MNLIERMLRRKPKVRPASPAEFSGTDAAPTDPAHAALAALSGFGKIGVQTSSHRFPKLSDSVGTKTEILARPAGSQYVESQNPASRNNAPPPADVNLWDLEDEPAAAPPLPRQADPVGDIAPRRRQNRTKTRLLGFEPSDASVVTLFDEGKKLSAEAETAEPRHVEMFPTGWLVVTKGPGRGATFPLKQGMSVIGRGTDQAVSLNFGDMAVSRSNHAAIAYDPTLHQFHVGHGGKSNLVRLNGRPLLSSEEILDGGEIQVGETTLMLKVLCTPVFNWSRSKSEGDENDMAIA